MATNLHNFISQYTVKIPIVQRDYVQGSDLNADKRNEFVKGIIDHLATRQPKSLHFIYGSVENANDYIPFDGQQRLTTLTLIGWLLLQCYRLSNPDENADAWTNMLEMTYETRNSSRMFVNNLIAQRMPAWHVTPSKMLKAQKWYAEAWNYDPTIKAMLNLLDYAKAVLEEKIISLAESSLMELGIAAEELLNILPTAKKELAKPAPSLLAISHKANVSAKKLASAKEILLAKGAEMANTFFTASPFEFEETGLNINTRKQMDDLYIKINARGKFLTEFENWKAHFIEMLETKHTSEVYRGKSFVSYFEDNIDGKWCDFFWGFCDKAQDAPRIDEFFMNFYNYVTKILCAAQGITSDFTSLGESTRIEMGNRLYAHPDNVRTLFDALNVIDSISENFFDTYLFASNDPKDPNIAVEKRVNIFDFNPTHLLDTVIKGDQLDIRKTLLLWGIICHESKYKGINTLEFIRLWWGYLMHRRQRLAKNFEVKADLEYSDIHKFKLLENLNILLGNADPFVANNITDKADWYAYNHLGAVNAARYYLDIIPLQNHPWLLYDVHNLDDIIRLNTIPPGQVYHRFFKYFVSLGNRQRVKAMLKNGFGGLLIEDKNKEKYTFGLTGNWAYILTDQTDTVRPVLTSLLRGFNPGLSANHTWLCEFIYKYVNDLNCWRFGGFDIADKYILYSVTPASQNRQGDKAEPFAYVTLCRVFPQIVNGHFKNKEFQTTHLVGSRREVNITFYNRNSSHYGICIKYADGSAGVQMECEAGGWRIRPYNPGANWVLPLPSTLSPQYYNGFLSPIPAGRDHITQGAILLKSLLYLL